MIRAVLLSLALLTAALPTFASASDPGSADPARARTDALIAEFEKVRSGANPEANRPVSQVIDDYLDFDSLFDQAVAPRREKFSKAQLDEFRNIFREMFRNATYSNSGNLFRDAELKIGKTRKVGEASVVPIDTRVPAEDMETLVELHWKESGGKLLLVDIAFDGDSLVADYRNQFTRIIDTEGVPALLAKTKAKLDEVKKGQAKK